MNPFWDISTNRSLLLIIMAAGPVALMFIPGGFKACELNACAQFIGFITLVSLAANCFVPDGFQRMVSHPICSCAETDLDLGNSRSCGIGTTESGLLVGGSTEPPSQI